jgi:two-component system chemotaxis response regulator CheY
VFVRRVLIIEDSSTTRAVIKVYLTGHNLDFLEAQDGIEGFSIAQKQSPNVIVVDLKMPGMDGFTFCRQVRADARIRSTPIILLTSSKGDAVKREALQAGATHFLNKPIDDQVLANVILGCLGQGNAGRPTP